MYITLTYSNASQYQPLNDRLGIFQIHIFPFWRKNNCSQKLIIDLLADVEINVIIKNIHETFIFLTNHNLSCTVSSLLLNTLHIMPNPEKYKEK